MRIGTILRSLAICALALTPLHGLAGKPTPSVVPLRAQVFDQFVDEQDTNAFYGNPLTCPYYGTVTEDANFFPDNAALATTNQWDYFNWNPKSFVAGLYEDHTNCSGANCLRVEFNTNNKVFAIDTRGGAAPLRTMTLDFTHPYGAVSADSFAGQVVPTPGLLQVGTTDPITSMAVCTTSACMEAKHMNTKFWFTDPNQSDVTWRIDWQGIRVLRVAENKWYFIAGQCGGTHLAGLSKLVGTRTKPRETLNGYFLMPLFIAVERIQ